MAVGWRNWSKTSFVLSHPNVVISVRLNTDGQTETNHSINEGFMTQSKVHTRNHKLLSKRTATDGQDFSEERRPLIGMFQELHNQGSNWQPKI